MGPAARVASLARRARTGRSGRPATPAEAPADRDPGPGARDPEVVRAADVDPDGRLDTGSATATGPRADNQDRSATGAGWAVVSDGAGGHRGGARAAELTVAAVSATLDRAGLRDGSLVDLAIGRADDAVRVGRDDPEVPTMAATVTVALVGSVAASGSTWWLANVGDSPAWRVGPGGAEVLLPADNVAAELVRVGMISEQEAASHPGRHQITRAVGGLSGPSRPAVAVTLEPGRCLVLASDGLLSLDGPAIARIVDEGTTAQGMANALVAAALAAGATDNVTAVVVRHRPG